MVVIVINILVVLYIIKVLRDEYKDWVKKED